MSADFPTEDDVRQQITDALSGLDLPGVVGAWIVGYEVSAAIEDGEVGSNWGWLGKASSATAVGLAHLVAADAARINEDDA